MDREEFKKGDIVKHRVSGQKLVVLYSEYGDGRIYACRYLNTVTGLYETQKFDKEELEKVDLQPKEQR
jgi:uncharacterized protein YodC (DUF2158 family)